MYHIGVDEAGRGPMIGPLVVAAIAIPKNDLELLKENNITDSIKERIEELVDFSILLSKNLEL